MAFENLGAMIFRGLARFMGAVTATSDVAVHVGLSNGMPALLFTNATGTNLRTLRLNGDTLQILNADGSIVLFNLNSGGSLTAPSLGAGGAEVRAEGRSVTNAQPALFLNHPTTPSLTKVLRLDDDGSLVVTNNATTPVDLFKVDPDGDVDIPSGRSFRVGGVAVGGSGGGTVSNLTGNSGVAGVERTSLCLIANTSDVTTTTAQTVMTLTGVGAGTWRVKATLIFQTGATTTGIGMGLNHTGTVTRFVSNWIHLTTGGAAATGISDQVVSTNTGQLAEGKAERVKNTISSNIAGVDTANADQLAVMDAIIIATSTGQIELKIQSEVSGSAVRLMTGTVLEIEKVA